MCSFQTWMLLVFRCCLRFSASARVKLGLKLTGFPGQTSVPPCHSLRPSLEEVSMSQAEDTKSLDLLKQYPWLEGSLSHEGASSSSKGDTAPKKLKSFEDSDPALGDDVLEATSCCH